ARTAMTTLNLTMVTPQGVRSEYSSRPAGHYAPGPTVGAAVRFLGSEYSSCPEGHYDARIGAIIQPFIQIGILLLPGRALRRLFRRALVLGGDIGILLLPGRALRRF